MTFSNGQDSLVNTTINSDTTNFNSGKDTTIQVKEAEKGSIETTIIYSARDSISMDIQNQLVTLKGNAHVTYGKISIEADHITINYNTNQIIATYTRDSTGKKIGIPKITDDGQEYYSDYIKYDSKTKRTTITHTLTRQNEGWIRGDTTVKTKDDILYIKNGEFCPCEDSTATTFVRSNKIKIIPGKRIVTGPAVLYVGDVPTPLVMPFGLFPATSQKSSGIIIPKQFGESERGFYLREGGYYWAVNDYVGIEFLGEVYSQGGWGLEGRSTYKSRYKFNGKTFFKYRNVVSNGDEPTRSEKDEYQFQWKHSPKSRGGKRFSSDVNIATATFNQNNENNTTERLTNSLNSNISYYTPLGRNSPFTLSMKLRHSQNNNQTTNTELTDESTGATVDMTLPDISLNMSRRLPFQNFKKGKRNMWNDFIRSTGVAYTMKSQIKMDNKASTESFPFTVANPGEVNRDFQEFHIDSMLARAEYGIQHTIPISASMKLGKSFTLNPSFNYIENWYPKKYDYEYIDTTEAVTVSEIGGFNRASWYSAAASVNTSYYMTYSFKGASESKLRHVIRPSISGRYSPDFTNTNRSVYTEVQTDSSGGYVDVSKYHGMIYNYSGGQEQATMGFSLQNNFELKKLKKQSDTTDLESLSAKERYKYIKLLDNLSFSGSYNFAADSLNLSKINIVASTKLFNIFTIQGRAVVDPYTYSESDNTRVNTFAWDVDEGIGTLESSSLSVGSSFSPKTFQNKNNNRIQDDREVGIFGYTPYVDFTVPWTFSANYNISYRKIGFDPSTTYQSFSFRGTLGLTDNWQITYSAAYDFENKNIITPRLVLSRDLKCWIMNFNWVPFGPYKFYNFALHIKASVLKDINLRRNKSYYDRER